MAYWAGKVASITDNGVSRGFKKWSLSMDTDILDVSNFNSLGFKQNLSGLIGATLKLSGPYDITLMPYVVGNLYVVTLAIGPFSISVTARIKNITPGADVAQAVDIDITMETTGIYTPATI